MPRIARWGALLLFLGGIVGCGAPDPRSEDVPVSVGYVTLDPRSQTPVVVLEEEAGVRALPIWIGFAEARSIASEMEKATPPRPNTHDLAKRVIDGLEGTVRRVVVTELREGIYFALLVLESQGRTVEIDARPSDAIAIALRYQAPLYVREVLLDEQESESDEVVEDSRPI